MNEVPDNWREEMVNYTTDEYHLRLLREGPHSHHEARVLGALKYRYKQIMGIKDPEPPNCQSSFKEFSKGVSFPTTSQPDTGFE